MHFVLFKIPAKIFAITLKIFGHEVNKLLLCLSLTLQNKLHESL